MYIDVPTRHADAIIAALQGTLWHAEDTGETVTTEDGEDHLTTLRLTRTHAGLGSIADHLPASTTLPRPSAAVQEPPGVQGAVYSSGDMVIGEDLQVEGAVFAEGSVTLRKDATVFGTVAAGGDVVLEEGAVAGDVLAGGQVRTAATAKTNAVIARRGVPNPAPASTPASAPSLPAPPAERPRAAPVRRPPSPPAARDRPAPAAEAEAGPADKRLLLRRLDGLRGERRRWRKAQGPAEELHPLLVDAMALAREAGPLGDNELSESVNRLVRSLAAEVAGKPRDGAQANGAAPPPEAPAVARRSESPPPSS